MTDQPGASTIINPSAPQPVEQMSADQARERVAQLKEDLDFGQKFARGDTAARNYWDRLHRQIQGIPPPKTAEGVVAEMQERDVAFKEQQMDLMRRDGFNEMAVHELIHLRPLTIEQKRFAEFELERMRNDVEWVRRWNAGDREARFDYAKFSRALAMPTGTEADQAAWAERFPFGKR